MKKHDVLSNLEISSEIVWRAVLDSELYINKFCLQQTFETFFLSLQFSKTKRDAEQ